MTLSAHSSNQPSQGFSRLKVVETSEYESEDEHADGNPWEGAAVEDERKGEDAKTFSISHACQQTFALSVPMPTFEQRPMSNGL